MSGRVNKVVSGFNVQIDGANRHFTPSWSNLWKSLASQEETAQAENSEAKPVFNMGIRVPRPAGSPELTTRPCYADEVSRTLSVRI